MRNIKKYRGEMKLSQKELAELLGVSRTTIIAAENNPNYCLSEERARRLAKIFKCSVFDFVDLTDYFPYKVTKNDMDAIKRQFDDWLKTKKTDC